MGLLLLLNCYHLILRAPPCSKAGSQPILFIASAAGKLAASSYMLSISSCSVLVSTVCSTASSHMLEPPHAPISGSDVSGVHICCALRPVEHSPQRSLFLWWRGSPDWLDRPIRSLADSMAEVVALLRSPWHTSLQLSKQASAKYKLCLDLTAN